MGDVIALYSALFLTLYLRYGNAFYAQFIDTHFFPFALVFTLWVAIFYIAGLYDPRRLRNNLDFFKILSLSIFVNALLTISFFYLTPTSGITPKTNLFVFISIFAIVELFWRRLFNRRTKPGAAPNRVLLIGTSEATEKIAETLRENLQLGYEICHWMQQDEIRAVDGAIAEIIKKHRINFIVIPRHFKKDEYLARFLYELLSLRVEIYDVGAFYELIFSKIPLADIEEIWFVENFIGQEKFYDQLKRAFEFMLALLLGVVLLPLEILIALLVRVTSPGPAIYKQVRVGKNEKSFMLYKFRTMRNDAEQKGAKWSKKNDARVTPLGKILRHSHLDELPQLVNVIKGNLSFVGPRPEQPEFVKLLEEKIPHYGIRHLATPGITGWAQISYRYGASVDDSYEKLQYDIYYLKNRSLVLDIAIILKTFKSFFVNQK